MIALVDGNYILTIMGASTHTITDKQKITIQVNNYIKKLFDDVNATSFIIVLDNTNEIEFNNTELITAILISGGYYKDNNKHRWKAIEVEDRHSVLKSMYLKYFNIDQLSIKKEVMSIYKDIPILIHNNKKLLQISGVHYIVNNIDFAIQFTIITETEAYNNKIKLLLTPKIISGVHKTPLKYDKHTEMNYILKLMTEYATVYGKESGLNLFYTKYLNAVIHDTDINQITLTHYE